MKRTAYYTALKELCDTAGITMEQAFQNATPYLVAANMVRHAEEGELPDLTTLEKLANYFGTGIDTFDPGHTVVPEGKKTYIIGPITGNPSFMEDFAGAEAYLSARGCYVFSPARITAAMPKSHMTRKNFMDLGIFTLSMCEQVALMPGWQTHSGCRMEKAYTDANGYPSITLSEGHIQDGKRILSRKEQP